MPGNNKVKYIVTKKTDNKIVNKGNKVKSSIKNEEQIFQKNTKLPSLYPRGFKKWMKEGGNKIKDGVLFYDNNFGTGNKCNNRKAMGTSIIELLNKFNKGKEEKCETF